MNWEHTSTLPPRSPVAPAKSSTPPPGSSGRGPDFEDLKGNRYFITSKATPADQAPSIPQCRDATEPWLFSADKMEDLRAWILACKDTTQKILCNGWMNGTKLSMP